MRWCASLRGRLGVSLLYMPLIRVVAGLTVTICVNGWLWKEQDIRTNFDTIKALNCATEVYSLKWETEQLLELGSVRSATGVRRLICNLTC